MIGKIIEYSAQNRFVICLGVAFFTAWGGWALLHTPLDAIPDLSDVQVIVYTEWEGRNPALIEEQITYPIVSQMLSAPRIKVVRGFSFFGYSFVYMIFEDGTDMYWARSRVLEYMAGALRRLPQGVVPVLGPDATGVGWVYQYALVDRSGKRSLAELRTLQDWYVRYWLKAVPGVADVASLGGFEKQYQIQLDPTKLLAYNLSNVQRRPLGREPERALLHADLATGALLAEDVPRIRHRGHDGPARRVATPVEDERAGRIQAGA